MSKDYDIRKEDLKKWDLKLRYPGYFNKWVFRIMTITLILFVIMVLGSNGYKLNFCEVSCPAESQVKCPNPLFLCQETEDYFGFGFSGSQCQDPKFKNKLKDCPDEVFTTEFLFPGQVIGNSPNFYFKYINEIGIGILAFFFIINHLIYKIWGKNENNN
jgi:hypothetical protein